METLQTIGAALGISLVSGFRLYATVLILGLGIRMGWFHLNSQMEHLAALADTRVLAVSGVAGLIEFFADKIPWLDSAWDSFHSFIRPVGAVILGATALGVTDPVMKLILIILCGGVAFSGHASKAATRLAVNHSPEPFSNMALSLAEDAAVPVGTWIAMSHPLVALGFVAIFLAFFLWLAPKVFRLLRSRWLWFRSLFQKRGTADPSRPSSLAGPTRY